MTLVWLRCGLGLGNDWIHLVLPTAAAAVLGFFLKKNMVVEVGPTGRCSMYDNANALSGWVGIGIFTGLAMFAVIVLNSSGPHSKLRLRGRVPS